MGCAGTYVTLSIGICFLIFGISTFFFLDNLIRAYIADGLAIKENSETFKLWTHPPADVFLEIYLMNVTNPDEAAAGLAKPRLQNQGPYVFKELRRKLNATFHGNGTVSFYEPVFYFFDAERSRGRLTDKITQLDLVVAGFSYDFSQCNGTGLDCIKNFATRHLLKYVPEIGFDLIEEIFEVQQRSIFKTYIVDELLFKGYTDPLLAKMKPLAGLEGRKLPRRVGLFYGRNGSANGVYTVDTGERDIHFYQDVTHFNGLPQLRTWTTPYANRIQGTIGHGFRPFLKVGDRVQIFAGDLCRSSELAYNTTSEVDGVETFLYKPPHDAGLPWPNNTDQAGFCVPDTKHCPPEGLMDQTACFGEPSFMGKPHFYHSDPRLGRVFDGLNPNEEDHNTVMHIDPTIGAVIDVDKRLMLYFPVRQSFITQAGGIKLESNTADGITTLFPVFWVNETAKVRPVVFDQILNMVYPAMAIGKYTPYAITAVGLLLVMIATIVLLNRWQKSRGNKSTDNGATSTSSSASVIKKKAPNRRPSPQEDQKQKERDKEKPLLPGAKLLNKPKDKLEHANNNNNKSKDAHPPKNNNNNNNSGGGETSV